MTTPHQSEAPFVGERVFQNRGVCLQAFSRCPTPSLLLFLFCSRPNFRATRIFTSAIHCTSFARERLLRRLVYLRSALLMLAPEMCHWLALFGCSTGMCWWLALFGVVLGCAAGLPCLGVVLGCAAGLP